MHKFMHLGIAAAVIVLATAPVQAETPVTPTTELQIAGPVLMVADLERSLLF
jgi:hypothetical protein